MKKYWILFAIATLLLASCTAEPVDVSNCVDTTDPAGFWLGLWHGMILPFSFMLSLFTDTIQIYAFNNTGGWYDFGFVFGASMILGGSSSGAREGIRRKKKS